MTVLKLADHFTNKEELSKFTRELQKDAEKNEPVILLDENGEVICTMLSSELTKKVLAQRILKRLFESPNLIDEIQRRLEHDEIVD